MSASALATRLSSPSHGFPPQDFDALNLIGHAVAFRDALMGLGMQPPSAAALLFMWTQPLDAEFKRLTDVVTHGHPDAEDGLSDLAGALEVLHRAVPYGERADLARQAFGLAHFER